MNPGLLFAVLAFFAWGIGDFLIQKSARRFGDWASLFFITFAGTVFLIPFIITELRELSFDQFLLLGFTSLIILIASFLIFRALRVGKLSVVEPVYALELPIAATFSFVFLREAISHFQLLLVIVLIVGIGLVSTRSFSLFLGKRIERGVLFAVIGTVCMGAVNFLFGVSARETSPLMINWFTSAFIFLVTGLYFCFTSGFRPLLSALRSRPGLICALCVSDNAAWVFYSYSTLFIPIALATSISESYIAFAALLGIFITGEKLRLHQIAGLVITVGAAIALGATLP